MRLNLIAFVCSLFVFIGAGSSLVNAQCASNTTSGTSCVRNGPFSQEINVNACGAFTSVTNYSPATYFRTPVLNGGCYSVSTCGSSIDTQISAYQGNATTNPFAYNDDNGPLCTGTAASINMIPNFTDFARVDVSQFNCLPGGTSSITVRVRQNNNLTFTSSAADMCQGQTRTISATPAPTTAFGNAGDPGTYSGTGVTGTTFTAPTPAGASQNVTLTYTFGFCTATQVITVYRNPSPSNAGPDQTVGVNNTVLAATNPAFGTGTWTVIAGSGTFSNANDPSATVTGLSPGINTFRWTVTNGPCTANSNDVNITFDGTPPTISCPGTQSGFLNAGCAFSLPNYISLVTTSDAVDPNPTVTQDPVPGSILSGDTTITMTSTDFAGNSATCTFLVTVSDTTSPTLVCPPTQVASVDSNCLFVIPDYTLLASISDNCTQNPTTSQSPPAGTTIPVVGGSFSFPITINATDASGNTSSCQFSFTLEDATDPVAVCQNITIGLSGGSATIVGTDVDGGSTDNCASGTQLTFSVSPDSFTAANTGPNPVVLTVTDENGNTDNCVAIVTIADSIPPVAVCQDVTLSLDPGGNAVLTPAQVDNGSSDNQGIASLVLSQTSFSCSDVGANLVDLIVTDVGGNTDTCTANITVQDISTPTAVCQDITLLLDPAGNGTVNPAQIDNGSSDNCSITSQILSDTSFTCADVGGNTVTLTVADSTGNSSSCTAQVFVQDTVPPVAVCQDITVILTPSGSVTVNASDVDNGSSDLCGISSMFLSQSTFFCGDAGTNQVTLTTIDGSGNAGSCTANVTVIDTVPPVLNCPTSITLPNDSGFCGTNVTWMLIATDNCSVTTTGTHNSGDFFNTGTTTITYTGVDPSGNTSTCSFDITVLDNDNPVITCPAPIVQGNDTGQCGAVVTWPTVNATDNCNIDTIIGTNMSGDNFPVGTTSVVYTATDSIGNQDTCSFNVTVNDTEAPDVTCPSDTTLLADTVSCSGIVSWGTPAATDNCAIDTVVSSAVSGTSFPIGTTNVLVTASDPAGNQDTCSFNITVNAQPLVGSATAQTFNCGHGVSCNGATDGSATASFSGGCAPYSYSWSNGDTTAAASGLGAGVHSVTITDGLGNMVVDSVSVTEPAALTYSVVADSIICDGSFSGSIALTVSGGNDCGAYSYSWSNGDTTANLSGLAPATYSFTVTDISGCSITDSVTILGQPAPAFSLGADTTGCPGVIVLNGPAATSYNWSTGDTTSSIGVTTAGDYSLTVTNSLGCEASDTINVAYHSTTTGFITPRDSLQICRQDILELDGGTGFQSYDWNTGSTTQTTLVAGFGGSIVLTATDNFGCLNVDSVFVNFVDQPNPTPTIIPGPDVNLCDGETVILMVDTTYSTYDWNTGDNTQSISVSAAGTFEVTVTDAQGCVGSSASAMVAVVQPPSPVIINSGDTLLSVAGTYSSYQWNVGGSPIAGETFATFTVTTMGLYSVTVLDSNGCEGTSDAISVTPPVSAEAGVQKLMGIEIFPNPTQGILNVRSLNPIETRVDLTIMDMYGKVVRNIPVNNLRDTRELDLSDLANGMYLIKVSDEDGRAAMLRFMIE